MSITNLTISDDDINWVETILNGVSFDSTRMSVIKNLESVDIQACPGSGKTTVLIAKLAILAHKWTCANKGICVMSHTNVAREEIQRRLGQTDVGRELLSYPHFIGTLHSFVNTFISLPWIRSKGIPLSVIDTKFVCEKRWRKLQYGTRSFLERKGKTSMDCIAKSLPISLDIGCGQGASSYKDVVSVIDNSHQNGEFTFDEMFLYANEALESAEYIKNAICSRFPIVFIDEAQDTDAKQWEIINKIFDPNSIICMQNFGDSNQAIFSSHSRDESSQHFPKEGYLTLNNSKRFCSQKAGIISNLSIDHSTINGEFNELGSMPPTVFLFDKEKIDFVIPTFSQHVLNTFEDSVLEKYQNEGVYVIGMVHKPPLTNNNLPASVSQYWQSYNPLQSSRSENPDQLIGFFRLARIAYISSCESADFLDWISRGLRRYINLNSSQHIGASNIVFSSLIAAFPLNEQQNVRKQLLSMRSLVMDTLEQWNSILQKVHSLCDLTFGITTDQGNFLAWIDEGPQTDANNNVYIYNDIDNNRSLPVTIGSIHSVKGRTHLATLVVETFWHNHNIQAIFPYLFGNPPRGAIQVRNKTRLKCHYVALSRARGLVGLALCKEQIDQSIIDNFIQCGWKIVYI